MAGYDHVLVPTDGSNGTERVLEHALSIARDHEATVHALYVVDQRRYLAAAKDTQDELIQALEEEGEVAVDDVAVRVGEAGLSVTAELRQGIPYKEVVQYAEDEGVDLVVMGTHGRTGRDRAVNLGSVTERVLENVNVPVLVVDID